MRKSIKLKTVLVLGVLLINSGCLKDNINSASSFQTSDTINMLTYLESNGDIINSPATLSTFINEQDLYSNLSNYVILDIRDPQLFADGHIAGAINIQSSDLLDKAKSVGSNVILVSQNGQSASYYGGLLRLDGLSNVYVLEFGMAGWNSHFADQWNFYNGNTGFSGFKFFNNLDYDKRPYTDLPEVELSSSGDIKSKIETRIQSLLSEKFDDAVTSVDNSGDTSNLIAFVEDAFNSQYYAIGDSTFDDEYIVCYDIFSSYQAGGPRDATIPMHAPHAALYAYYHDLKSIYYLQTIPSNKKVIIYSRSGHQSAFAMAYLRLLGYTNVRSILFGATWLSPFPGSMNYPYVN